MKTIEIGLDVYKAIEAARESFGESEDAILRRLLNGVGADATPARGAARAFIEDNVEFPDGTEARMSYLYGRQKYVGRFVDGCLVVEGKSYTSLSAAASDLATTKHGEKTSLNGWKYWEVRRPDEDEWVIAEKLRE